MFTTLNAYTLSNHKLTIDDSTKTIKFARAFQFLELLIFQRVHGLNFLKRSKSHSLDKNKTCQFDIFLGGSCNPTTWRLDQAIPYLKCHSLSYYNPQVENWTPDLVEIEHAAKELAPLLFFVIDHETRSLSAIAEVCYLSSTGRNIIVVLSPMPNDKYRAKFIQQKKCLNDTDNQLDYDNACQSRNILKVLLRSINVPVFNNIRIALECAAYILETTRRIIKDSKTLDKNNHVKVEQLKKTKSMTDSVDNIRHLFVQSNEISETPHRRHSIQPVANLYSSYYFPFHESVDDLTTTDSHSNDDDDGYDSIVSSNRTLSMSSSSLSSDQHDYLDENQNQNTRLSLPISIVKNILSIFSSYIKFVYPSMKNSSLSQSIFAISTLPYHFLKSNLFPTTLNNTTTTTPTFLFDLYIASGEYDLDWLSTCVLPILDELNLKYTRNESFNQDNQYDINENIHKCRQSHLLFYLINSTERLTNLINELSFVLGEHNHKIVVYLETKIDENSSQILTKHERQDLERSRKYLEDLVRKENVQLCQTREQSWQHILAYLSLNKKK